MKDDFTVWSREYVAVSIYNKYAEMKSQKKGVFPESEIQRAKNIVRMEIRCMEGKIQALKKKYGITISAESEDNKKHFASVAALADFVAANRA